MSSGSPIAKRSSVRGSPTASSTKPQSSEMLTTSLSPVRLKSTRVMSTWLRRVFPVRHSQMQESKGSRKTRGTNGRKRSKRFGMFDLDTRSWKTSPVCFLLDTFPRSSPTLPKRGSMSSGLCWEPMTLEPPTAANDSGYWPTPTVAHVQYRNHDEPIGNYLKRVKDYEEGRARGKPGKSLGVAVRLWPTPAAHEGRLGYQRRDTGKKGTQKSLSTEVIDEAGGREQVGGQLNPDWVDWLMGWPIGMSASGRLEMDKFRSWLRAHGES